jgi:hypothetical protein
MNPLCNYSIFHNILRLTLDLVPSLSNFLGEVKTNNVSHNKIEVPRLSEVVLCLVH